MFKIASVHTGFPMAQRVSDAISALSDDCSFVNIADDNVLAQIRSDGCVTETSFNRVAALMKAAELSSPDLLLVTCSSIGGIADEYAKTASVPVLRIDEPMAAEAAAKGEKVVVVGTNQSTIGPSCEIVERKGAEAGKTISTYPLVLDRLFPIMKAESKEAAVKYAAEEITKVSSGACDVIMLAQASLTGFREDIEAALNVPVLASIPICAAYIKETYLK